jgi:4-hydroxybenzoyl-CoA thioesterase
VLRIETDYERPLAHGDHATVELETERVGAHSVTLRYRVLRPGAEEPAAVSRIVICAIEVPGWTKAKLPERVRRAFERHLPGGGGAA